MLKSSCLYLLHSFRSLYICIWNLKEGLSEGQAGLSEGYQPPCWKVQYLETFLEDPMQMSEEVLGFKMMYTVFEGGKEVPFYAGGQEIEVTVNRQPQALR